MKKVIKFKGLKLSSRLLYLLLASALFSPLQTQAETEITQQHYISPRLQLGLHTQASLDSPIKVLISSGKAVEVIKTEEQFSLIKTTEGVEGWVKSKFLSTEEPAELKIEKMRSALQRAQQSLKDRLQDEAAGKTSEIPSETDSGMNTSLSDEEKAAYEGIIAGLKEELKAWEQLDRQDKQALQEQAEKKNQILKEKLAMIASVAIGQDVDTSQFNLTTQGELPEIVSKTKQTFLKIIKKNYLLLLMISGLSFFLGIFVMDVIIRKRHGGYRI